MDGEIGTLILILKPQRGKTSIEGRIGPTTLYQVMQSEFVTSGLEHTAFNTFSLPFFPIIVLPKKRTAQN